nr:MAG TPA: hypothetical protein [Caudoviricetes sp.]
MSRAPLSARDTEPRVPCGARGSILPEGSVRLLCRQL